MIVGGKRLTIEIFGLEMVMHGWIETRRRLTDLANDSEAFFLMSDVESYPYPGDSLVGLGRRRHGIVNKDSVLMLTELETDVPSVSSQYLRVAKTRTRILAYIDGFALEADIHMPEGAEVEQFLVLTRGRFVPVTDATATPLHEGSKLSGFSRPFLLLNRDHISFLGAAEPEAAEAAPPEADKTA